MRSASWLLLSLGLLRAQAADMYGLDPVNTRISFNIRYFGTPWVSARFPDFGGQFVLDRHGAASRVDVSIQMASVDCHDSYWNDRLRSPDWLDVQRYPQMSFHSEHVEFQGSDRAVASGELNLHGITRPEVFSMQGQLTGNTITGAASTLIHLQDFKMKPPQTTSVVTITVSNASR